MTEISSKLKFTQISKFEGQKGHGLGRVTNFYILEAPPYSGMGKARDFKFGVSIDCQVYKAKNAKVGQRGRGLRHVTYFYNFCNPATSLFDFWDPSVSMQGVK